MTVCVSLSPSLFKEGDKGGGKSKVFTFKFITLILLNLVIPLLPKTTISGSDFRIIITFLCLMLMGGAIIPLLNVQLNPSKSLPRLTVHYTWPDAAAKVIEQEVTAPLEGVFSGIGGITKVSSVSGKGSGRIELHFDKHKELEVARFEVANLIRQVYPDLPARVSYPYINLGASGNKESPILTYTINASASAFYIQQYAQDILVPQLSKIEGINEVTVYGASPYEWNIIYQVNQIQNYQVSANEIQQAVNRYFQQDPLGQVSWQNNKTGYPTYINAVLQMDKPAETDFGRIPIKKSGNRVIHLQDVATVKYLERPPDRYFRVNGLNTVNLVITPEKDINTLVVTQKAKDAIASIRQELPAGYSLMQSYDASRFIKAELEKIALRAGVSLLILLLFVFVISRQPRYMFLILASLLANLLIAALLYYWLQVEIHLYSLAGITISLGFIIDSSIIMIDHYRLQHNRRVFLALLAATLTTIGALSIIFFLKESQRIDLMDFALVVMINLTVSLLVALFFIPSLMHRFPLRKSRKRKSSRSRRRIIRLNRVYQNYIKFGQRYRWAFIVLLILGFGLPVEWLPEKIEKENKAADFYNQSLGSDWFQNDAKPLLSKIMGGSLRLFSNFVYESSFYQEPTETKLYVRGDMPEGCTIEQLNEAIEKMENFISQFEEVDLFQTTINNYNDSRIEIHFQPEHEWTSFPYFLKSQLESKAISLGGLDWSVYGVGRGFSNALHTGFKSNRIVLRGYNYDQLYRYAEHLQAKLLQNPRIKEIDIAGSDGWRTTALHEYFLDFDQQQLALHNLHHHYLYEYLYNIMQRSNLSPVYLNNEMQPVTLYSDKYQQFNVWQLENETVKVDSVLLKLNQFLQMEKRKTGNDIHKENQQYQLVVAYDFIGPGPLAQKVEEEHIEYMNGFLPMGYKASPRFWSGWQKDDQSQYYLLLVVILIIYFVCSILLESFKQPLAIISLIPFAYIGVFLTFYLFDINFDQGGFASFILLSGLVVNAGLYIINDYNNFKKKRRASICLFVKAYNHKIIPILLTIISTLLGLVPFLWGGQKEIFWFAFAAGAMGGLLFSVLAIVFYLPVMMRIVRKSL